MQPVFHKFSSSLTVKYVAFALFSSLLPLLFLHSYATRSASEMLMTSLSNNLQEKAFLVARDIDQLITDRISKARILSQADVLEGGDIPAIMKYLNEIISETDDLDDLDILDLDGRITACTSKLPETHRHISEVYPEVHALFEKATKAGQGEVYVSEALILGSGPGIVLLTPVTNESNTKVIRVLMLEFNMKTILDIVANFERRVIGDEHAYLVDNNGRVIASPDNTVNYLEMFPDLKVKPELLDAFAIQGENGSIIYSDRDSHEVVAGYADMAEFGLNKALDWSLIAKAPVQEIIAPSVTLHDHLLIFTFSISGLITILIFLGSRGIVLPITKIAALANDIAKGNLSQDIKIRRHDEIGQLARSISHMIEALREGEKENNELATQLTGKISALKESETRLHTIIQSVADALIIIDKNGVIESVNPATEKTFGYSAHELHGREAKLLFSPIIEMAPETTRQGSESNLINILKKNQEIEGRHKDGYLFPMEASLAPMQLDNQLVFVGIMRDITNRKEAEKALRAASELNNKIFEESPIGLSIYDQSGQCIAANNSVGKMIGATREQVLAQNYKTINSWQNYGLFEAAQKSITTQVNQRHEFNIATTFGKKAFYDCLFVPFTIHDERRLLFMIDDISKRKEAEKQQKIALEEKEILLKEIHHRVKNNMQIISSLLYLQSQKTKNPEAMVMITESQSRIKTMALIHEKLYSSGNFTKINFDEYIRTLCEYIFKSYSLSSRVKLLVDATDIYFSVDIAIPCGLIINELVTNSLKHAFPDGRDGEIKITLSCTEQRATLAFSDNGMGLPADHDMNTLDTLGMNLIQTLGAQLKASLEFHNDHGLKYSIVFDIDDTQEQAS